MTGQRVGYVRVSTLGQNTGRQDAALADLAVDRVFTDKASGRDTDRPALTECLTYVREGDTLVVGSMDRLARSLPDLRRIVDELTARGVAVEFVKEGLTFTSDEARPMAKLMLNLLGAFAEFERELTLERQREGIALAKAAGKYRGRAARLSDDEAKAVARRHAEGGSASALAREYGVARSTIYNAIRAHNGAAK